MELNDQVRANRIDVRLVSHERKEVCTIEMSCPWIESRAKKDEEKTLKYGPMMWELKQRYNGYRVEQYNVIIDALGGYSKHLEKSVRKLLGARARSVLERMQKSVILNTLNIIRQKSKADFTVGNILSFSQYFGRNGLPSSGSYI